MTFSHNHGQPYMGALRVGGSNVPSYDGTQSGKPSVKFSTQSVREAQAHHRPAVSHPAASGSALQASLIQLWAMHTNINTEIKERKKKKELHPTLPSWSSRCHLGKVVLGDGKHDKPILQYFQHNRVSYSVPRILLYCLLQPFTSICSICDLLPSNRKRVFLWCILGRVVV